MVIFPSEKFHSHSSESVHNLTHKRENLHQLHRTPRKCEAWASIFVEMIRTVIPCTVCEHIRVSPSNISFRHRRNFFLTKKARNIRQPLLSYCTQPPSTRSVLREGVQRAVPYYHGLSFFFLERLSSFFPERKEERCGNYIKRTFKEKL